MFFTWLVYLSFDCTPPWCAGLHEICCLWVEGGGGCHTFYTLLCCCHVLILSLCDREVSCGWFVGDLTLCVLLTSVSALVPEVFLSDRKGQRAEVWICVCTFLAQSDPIQRWSVGLKYSSRCQCQTFFHLTTGSTWSEQPCSLSHWEDWLQQTLWCLATRRTFVTRRTSLVQSCFINSYCHLTGGADFCTFTLFGRFSIPVSGQAAWRQNKCGPIYRL